MWVGCGAVIGTCAIIPARWPPNDQWRWCGPLVTMCNDPLQ